MKALNIRGEKHEKQMFVSVARFTASAITDENIGTWMFITLGLFIRKPGVKGGMLWALNCGHMTLVFVSSKLIGKAYKLLLYWLLNVCVFTPQGEPEPFEETNVDRLMSSLAYGGGSTGTGNGSLGVKAHRGSDSSTLSSQPSIDEVRTQMHMLLGNAFSLAPPDHDPPSPPTK